MFFVPKYTKKKIIQRIIFLYFKSDKYNLTSVTTIRIYAKIFYISTGVSAIKLA